MARSLSLRARLTKAQGIDFALRHSVHTNSNTAATLMTNALLGMAEYNWAYLGNNLAVFAIFGLVGIVMAILGYKLFDKFTPGDLHDEIVNKKNLAAAVLAGSVIISVAIVLAAAMG
jgi:uncharacterized membrane protein YjfL (UPF0719 family)